MTTIIAPSGEAVGSTFLKPKDYAAQAQRRGWEVAIVGERVYLAMSKKFEAHLAQAMEQAK